MPQNYRVRMTFESKGSASEDPEVEKTRSSEESRVRIVHSPKTGQAGEPGTQCHEDMVLEH